MLVKPTYITHPVGLGIDPGTTTLGISVMAFDPILRKFNVLIAYTLDAKSVKEYGTIHDIHGDRQVRLYWLGNKIDSLLQEWGITEVYCEAPYLGRFPGAFASLTECVNMIRSSVLSHNSAMPFTLIDPSTVKTAIGVRGKDPEKNNMRIAINSVADITVPSPGYFDGLDEHAIDATSVVYSGMRSRYMLI